MKAHSLKEGLKIGKKVKNGAHEEVKQLNDRTVWQPAHPNYLTTDEKCKAMESLFFLTEKIKCITKCFMCANGSTQIIHVLKEEAPSPMEC